MSPAAQSKQHPKKAKAAAATARTPVSAKRERGWVMKAKQELAAELAAKKAAASAKPKP